MSRRPPNCLFDLLGERGYIIVKCPRCKREVGYETRYLYELFLEKKWSDQWHRLPERFRCSGPWGCGWKPAKVSFALGTPMLPLGKAPRKGYRPNTPGY